MKKKKMSKYNKIAFIVIPLLIVLIGVLFCLYSYRVVCLPHISEEEITARTQSGELYMDLRIEEESEAYLVCSLGSDYYHKDYNDDHLIAFKGSSIRELESEIYLCNSVRYAMSYWEGEAEVLDLTNTKDFADYMVLLETNVPGVDREIVKQNYSHVMVYDLDDYLGYRQVVDNDSLLGLYFNYFVVLLVAPLLIILEIAVALVIKTLFL